MVDGILLLKCGMRTMKNGNLSLLSKSLQTNIPSSILMSRSKNVACVPLCSCFSCNSPGYMHLKDFENSPSSFIAQRSSMNRLVAWYLYDLVYFLEIRFSTWLESKK